ncbi:hypothetical protein P5673_024879 [Acropora cervicornis]|uniref:NADH dehydrogenase [ubiquinone] iron-sulfur protein 5 n=1 Tax=Acropora cervicornis TaxID=6130 RepID=A0AAD9Q3G7_ACRCE|nr:hypothetical protein P5673_024879 [Acropora cervicornis]
MSMYGIDGNRSRCSHFWDDFLSCVHRVGRNDHWVPCKNYREDYFECLHHKKLVFAPSAPTRLSLLQVTKYTRIGKIQKQKEKLIREGKWPPKVETQAEL